MSARKKIVKVNDSGLDQAIATFCLARESKFCRDHRQTIGVGQEPRNYRSWNSVALTTKNDLRKAYPFGLLVGDRNRLASYHESTGSTGIPTSSFFTARDLEANVERFLRNAAALSSDDTILIKTPYSMVTTAHQMHLAAMRRGALIVPADNRSSNMTYPKVIRLLKDVGITLTWSMPTELILWAETAKLLGYEVSKDFPKLTRFIVAGESMSQRKKRHIEMLWGGKRVFQDYGSTETGSLAGECEHGHLHLWQDHFFFEVWDEQARRASVSGRGQLVVTTLTREAMPLVRYLTEDEVEIDNAKCACGSPHSVIRVLGRPLSRLWFGGRAFYQSEVEDAIYSVPEEFGLGFWRAKKSGDCLDVEIEVDSIHAPIACDEIAHEIFRRLNLRAEVRAVPQLTFTTKSHLLKEPSFKKPRFLFSESEDWTDALNYF